MQWRCNDVFGVAMICVGFTLCCFISERIVYVCVCVSLLSLCFDYAFAIFACAFDCSSMLLIVV